ncbi:MAG: hypothetical protein QW279_09180, partial [Candidatus Jordarchaeaceae archaeon]
MPITVSEALGLLERAFRMRNPNEIESVFRDNLSVKVAVIESIQETEQKICEAFYPVTVSIPYFIFKLKARDKEVYEVKENLPSDDKPYVLRRVDTASILPNRTYFLLRKEAGYLHKLGLTFDGEGKVTGFEAINEGEKAEKLGGVREQDWEGHAKGAYNRAIQILEIYRSFVSDWFKNVFKTQKLNDEKAKETIEAIIYAIKISVFFHDIGKLRKQWQ